MEMKWPSWNVFNVYFTHLVPYYYSFTFFFLFLLWWWFGVVHWMGNRLREIASLFPTTKPKQLEHDHHSLELSITAFCQQLNTLTFSLNTAILYIFSFSHVTLLKLLSISSLLSSIRWAMSFYSRCKQLLTVFIRVEVIDSSLVFSVTYLPTYDLPTL